MLLAYQSSTTSERGMRTFTRTESGLAYLRKLRAYAKLK